MRLWLLALAVVLVSTPAGFASSRSQQEHGASVFAESGCLHCHSIRHTGGSRGPDLSGVGSRLKEAQMRRQIVYGSKQMPPYGDALQEQEFADLIAYLRSCRDKKK
jgi:mono/diheme cytochrome c family protein